MKSIPKWQRHIAVCTDKEGLQPIRTAPHNQRCQACAPAGSKLPTRGLSKEKVSANIHKSEAWGANKLLRETSGGGEAEPQESLCFGWCFSRSLRQSQAAALLPSLSTSVWLRAAGVVRMGMQEPLLWRL